MTATIGTAGKRGSRVVRLTEGMTAFTPKRIGRPNPPRRAAPPPDRALHNPRRTCRNLLTDRLEFKVWTAMKYTGGKDNTEGTLLGPRSPSRHFGFDISSNIASKHRDSERAGSRPELLW